MGYATDHSMRWTGQSGGLVTALLVFALEEGLIDGAVVTRMSKSDPLSPETVVAESKKEILNASKSKYCPVPLNVAVKEVLKKNGKYAIVGIPCQIHGIRKLEMIESKLKNKIILHLGLFCSHTLSYDQLNEFADISLGDAFLPGVLINCKEGMSILISRTEIGERVLQEASRAGAIKVQKIPRSKVAQSQRGALFRKKKVLGERLMIARFLGKSVPEYDVKLPKPRRTKCFKAVLDYMNTQIPYNPITFSVLKHVPLPLLRLYGLAISMVDFSGAARVGSE